MTDNRDAEALAFVKASTPAGTQHRFPDPERRPKGEVLAGDAGQISDDGHVPGDEPDKVTGDELVEPTTPPDASAVTSRDLVERTSATPGPARPSGVVSDPRKTWAGNVRAHDDAHHYDAPWIVSRTALKAIRPDRDREWMADELDDEPAQPTSYDDDLDENWAEAAASGRFDEFPPVRHKPSPRTKPERVNKAEQCIRCMAFGVMSLARSGKRCDACFRYRRRTGVERPGHYINRAFKEQP